MFLSQNIGVELRLGKCVVLVLKQEVKIHFEVTPLPDGQVMVEVEENRCTVSTWRVWILCRRG